MSDLNAEAQLTAINNRQALMEKQASPMQTVHKPGSLAAEILIKESIIGQQSGLNKLYNQESNGQEKIKNDGVKNAKNNHDIEGNS